MRTIEEGKPTTIEGKRADSEGKLTIDEGNGANMRVTPYRIGT